MVMKISFFKRYIENSVSLETDISENTIFHLRSIVEEVVDKEDISNNESREFQWFKIKKKKKKKKKINFLYDFRLQYFIICTRCFHCKTFYWFFFTFILRKSSVL